MSDGGEHQFNHNLLYFVHVELSGVQTLSAIK